MEPCRPVLWEAGISPRSDSSCVPETPLAGGGGGGMYDTGDPGPPCWKDAPEDGGAEKEEEEEVGKKGGWEGAEEDRHWLIGGCPG